MVCQQTCVQYATDESTIVNNPTYCPGPDLTNGTRLNQLLKDFTDCTNWTTLATSNLDTCVLGSTNEGNCGYGSSTTQLCGHCSGSSPEDCCYACTSFSVRMKAKRRLTGCIQPTPMSRFVDIPYQFGLIALLHLVQALCLLLQEHCRMRMHRLALDSLVGSWQER